MREYQLGAVILEREFEAHDTDGNLKLVKLLIGKPQPDKEPTYAWYCPFQILGVGDRPRQTRQPREPAAHHPLPEVPFDEELFLAKVKETIDRKSVV